MSPPLPSKRELLAQYGRVREELDHALAGITAETREEVHNLRASLILIADDIVELLESEIQPSPIPTPIQAIKTILQHAGPLTVDQILVHMANRGWTPELSNPRGYVFYILATKGFGYEHEEGGPKRWRYPAK